MFDFHEKRKIRNLVYSKPVIVLLLVAIGFLSLSVFERFTTLTAISEKRERKETELAELSQRAAALKAKVEYLEEGRGVEEELRNRFDVAKEGEQVVVIVGEHESVDSEALTRPPGEVDEQPAWWEFLKFW